MTAETLKEQATPATQKQVLSRLARGASGGLITVAEASQVLDRDRRSTSNLLARFARHGWLSRVRRGLYYVLPLKAGAGEIVSVEDPWVLARELFKPCYIGGWSAAEHWGLTEQLFRSTFVVTAASVRRRAQKHLGAEYRLVLVPARRLQRATLVWREAERVPVSDREHTIADALNAPAWVGGIRHLSDILVTYWESRDRDDAKLLRALKHVGKGAAFKRLGFIVEHLFPKDEEMLAASRTGRTAGIVKLDPSVKSKGKLNTRWGLWVNATIAKSGTARD